MTIQDTIVDALQKSLAAHRRALTTIASLSNDKATLETEVAALKARVKTLEAEAVKIVELGAIQNELDTLDQLIAEFAAVTLPPAQPPAPATLVAKGSAGST